MTAATPFGPPTTRDADPDRLVVATMIAGQPHAYHRGLPAAAEAYARHLHGPDGRRTTMRVRVLPYWPSRQSRPLTPDEGRQLLELAAEHRRTLAERTP
jgi:hypothetical protein